MNRMLHKLGQDAHMGVATRVLPPECRNAARWQGLLVPPGHIPPTPLLAGYQIAEEVSNYQYVIPTFNQQGPCCMPASLCGAMATLIRKQQGRRAFPEGKRLDETAAHIYARNKFYGGNLDGGLYAEQAFQAMLEMGFYPPEAVLVEDPLDLAANTQTLKNWPMVIGLRMHEGFFKPDWRGIVNTAPQPIKPPQGHAIQVASIVADDDNCWFYGILQTWGDIGVYGYEFVAETEVAECWLGAGPWHVEWDPNNWSGWRDHLVENDQE